MGHFFIKGNIMETGLIVDVETTGLDPSKDKIIEFACIKFAIIPETFDLKILSTYSSLEDPGIAVSAEITKITGLDNAILHNQKVDWNIVRTALEEASIVVAHNAEFDRGFIENRVELAEIKKHWACSLKHIRWKKHGFNSRALNYLAADHGFINPFAHRALFDCATTFRLIQNYFAELHELSFQPEMIFFATNATFSKKDLLRDADYRWNNEQRVWSKRVFQCDSEQEKTFLREKIYDGYSQHTEKFLTLGHD